MEHVTIGKKFGEGKIAYAECVTDGDLSRVDIKGKGFLLVCLWEGTMTFSVGGKPYTGHAPCFLCFDEEEDPVFGSTAEARYACVWFRPLFLNVNMTLARIRSQGYEDVASVHDLFLLRPFLEHSYVIPCQTEQIKAAEKACRCMERELTEQRDWYWSCRGRSYFMELLIALERSYAEVGYGKLANEPYGETTSEGALLQDAILYLEGCFSEDLNLERVCNHLGVSRSALTAAFRKEMNSTVMEYLMAFRVKVAKKHLAFTEIPQKEIALRCGFKTVPHFARVFKNHTGQTPGDFRKTAVQKRKDEIK